MGRGGAQNSGNNWETGGILNLCDLNKSNTSGNAVDPWETGDARSQNIFMAVILTAIFTAMRIEKHTLNMHIALYSTAEDTNEEHGI